MSSQFQSKSEDGSTAKMSFVEKYALQYYTTTLLYVAYWTITYYFEKPFYFYAFITLFPFLGKLMPRDDLKITNSKYHNKNIYQALPLAACVITNFIFIANLCINFPYLKSSGLELSLASISIALLITPSIVVAHELIHRPEFFFRAIGFLNMTVFLFNVYPTEHLYLHHKFVGTDKDPITSKKNFNLYFYTIRAFFSAHAFVFKFSKLIFLGCMSLVAAYLAAIYFHGLHQYADSDLAWTKLSFFIRIGLGGFFALELVEYVEHYGLIFREDVDKKEINELSSWNADGNMLANWMIFRFQRHSDHHMNAYKIFTTLELNGKMPLFPMSFFEAIYMALCPPLWYYIMNPYVDEQLENKKVEQSHRNFVLFLRNFIFVMLIGLCVYFYHRTVSPLAFLS